MKLVYHQLGSSHEISPFDTALLQVSDKANPLYIASPYIGLGFLKRITDHSIDWMLISDVEAWLSSGNRKHRAQCWQFIVDNNHRIKHIPQLHAKVAIGNGLLFLGSANFTEKGVLGRDEMSVLINDQKLVQESIDWFNALWRSASPPIIKEGDELLEVLDELQWTAPRASVKLSSSAVKVQSILDQSIRPSGYDVVSSFALHSITESSELVPLEEAYAAFSDRYCANGQSFSFKEIREATRPHPVFTNEALWNLVIRETVNHWLGGLMPEGFDRYVFDNGRFEKWTPSKLALVTSNDSTLAFVIEKLEVSPKTSLLPKESEWLTAEIPQHRILPLIGLLTQSGILLEVDNPGELERYSIDTQFEWPKRWNKFASAHAAFDRKKVAIKPIAIKDESEENNEFRESSDYLDSLEANKTLKGMPIRHHISKNMDTKHDVEMRAKELDMSFKELIDIREQYLLEAFSNIEPKIGRLKVSDLQENIRTMSVSTMSVNLMMNFKDLQFGPFRRFLQLRKWTEDKLILSNDWPANQYLTHYPKALKKWQILLGLSNRVSNSARRNLIR